MTRLLTPEEIAALRAEAPYIPAPRERFHVVVEAGETDLAPEEVDALRVGHVVELARPAGGLAIVVNGITVALGELVETGGRTAVRVTALARPETGTDRGTR